MSICNVWFECDRALVVVDTEVMGPGGELLQVSKLCALPHAHAVMAARGHLLFANRVFTYWQLAGGDFDSMIDRASEVLELAFEETLQHAAVLDVRDQSSDLQEIVLAGWSPRQDRMAASVYKHSAAEGFTVDTLIPPSFYLAPWDNSMTSHPMDQELPADPTRICRAQVARSKELFPRVGCGGEAIAAHLFRDHMLIVHHPIGDEAS